MDAWEHIRRAAQDRRSGSIDIALRAARGLAMLSTKRDLARAARMLLRAHPTMGAVWRSLAATVDGESADAFARRLEAETAAVVDAVRWLPLRRSATVLTFSSSGTVADALERIRPRVARVLCAVSLSGGEGRAFARRLQRDGFDAEVVSDAAIARAAAHADVALVGADAVTEAGIVNKLGTRLVALAAADAGIGCYALAGTSKMIPAATIADVDAPAYEWTPLELLDAVVTERGPLRAGPVRRAVGRVAIPPVLEAALA